MAKGIDILGTLRGKRGGVVYYRANGAQLSRPRVTPKNPRSAKQAVQRMVLSSAAKLAGIYRPIVNHSIEGMSVGEKQVNVFRSRAMKLLRQAASVYIGDATIKNQYFADYPLKGSPSTGFVNGLEISRGSLAMNPFIIGLDDEVLLKISEGKTFNYLTLEIESQQQYAETLAAIGLAPGDQLTLVLHGSDPTRPVASFVYGDGFVENDYPDFVRFARITFAPSFPEGSENPLLVPVSEGSDQYVFNAGLIVESQGTFPELSSATFQEAPYLSINTGLGSMFVGAGLIRSQKVDGKWKYSSSVMLCNTSALDSNNAYPTYLSYMDGASEVEVGSQLYLRHAEEASPL